MQIGILGIGRMGRNIAERLTRGGQDVVAFNRSESPVAVLASEGATTASSLAATAAKLATPRIFWSMLPAGAPAEPAIETLLGLCTPGDIVIDGGNTFHKDDIRRGLVQHEKAALLQCGTSSGVWGLDRVYCMMIDGDKEAVDRLDPIFATLAPGFDGIPRTLSRDPDDGCPERGSIHAGPAGAGHFVKMVRNGIEYGLTPAYAEGFDILKSKASEKGDGVAAIALTFVVPLKQVAVVGDMPNDLPMFARAGLAIAMGQAPGLVRNAADWTTVSNEGGGVAQAIGRLLGEKA